MSITIEQKKNAYKKLPWKVQTFIMDGETTEAVNEYLKKSQVNDDNFDLADSEILYAMLELQNLNDAITNIAKTTNKSESELLGLRTNLQTNIFDKIESLKQGGDTDSARFELDKNADTKISEIAKKYNLDEPQSALLLKIIRTHSISNSKLNELSESITENLGVSSLISEQIMEDLKNRVFVEAKPESAKIITPQENYSAPKPENKSILEIRPPNLPSVEEGTNMTAGVPTYSPRPKVVVDTEPVQTPLTVPRFKAVPMDDTETNQSFIPNINPKPNVSGIMDSKLNSVTKSIDDSQPPARPKYTVDPYREPIS